MQDAVLIVFHAITVAASVGLIAVTESIIAVILVTNSHAVRLLAFDEHHFNVFIFYITCNKLTVGYSVTNSFINCPNTCICDS